MEILKIFDADDLYEQVPIGFNGVRIKLDSSLKSSLDWTKAKDAASKNIEKGLKIFWELDFGLGKGLDHPLGHNSQFLSFKLAVEHFCTEIWQHFHQDTTGIALYRGSADFSLGFIWDEEQLRRSEDRQKEFPVNMKDKKVQERLYCRDAVGEYIELLAGHLPEQLPIHLLIDAGKLNDPLELANIAVRDRFPNLNYSIGKGSLPSQALTWYEGSSYQGYIGKDLSKWNQHPLPVYGICSPSLYRPIDRDRILYCLKEFESRKVNYKLLSEELLILEWEGLDYLVVAPENLSSQGLRKLKGFCAAGGTIINLGNFPLNLSQEKNWTDWTKVPLANIPQM